MWERKAVFVLFASIISELYKQLIPMSKYPEYLRGKGVKIGTDCEIYKSANFGSEPYLISIGNHVRINSGVYIITHDGGMWVLRSEKSGFAKKFYDADKFGKVVIEDNVHIGTNAIIMPGVTIGSNSIVGCGAVVTHNVEANTVVAGVPARKIETLSEYAFKNKDLVVNTKHMGKNEKRDFLMGILNNCKDN